MKANVRPTSTMCANSWVTIERGLGGKGVWKRELGAAKITDGGVDASGVWLVQDGKRRVLDPATGRDL